MQKPANGRKMICFFTKISLTAAPIKPPTRLLPAVTSALPLLLARVLVALRCLVPVGPLRLLRRARRWLCGRRLPRLHSSFLLRRGRLVEHLLVPPKVHDLQQAGLDLQRAAE